jgi:hypothetical protein
MSIGLVMKFEGVSAEQYEAVMAKENLDLRSPKNSKASDEWPDGILSHLAGATPSGGWCVVDVWESQAQFDKFFANRLGPALQKVGLPEPEVTPVDVYNRH